jgi:hypothetical protein
LPAEPRDDSRLSCRAVSAVLERETASLFGRDSHACWSTAGARGGSSRAPPSRRSPATSRRKTSSSSRRGRSTCRTTTGSPLASAKAWKAAREHAGFNYKLFRSRPMQASRSTLRGGGRGGRSILRIGRPLRSLRKRYARDSPACVGRRITDRLLRTVHHDLQLGGKRRRCGGWGQLSCQVSADPACRAQLGRVAGGLAGHRELHPPRGVDALNVAGRVRRIR